MDIAINWKLFRIKFIVLIINRLHYSFHGKVDIKFRNKFVPQKVEGKFVRNNHNFSLKTLYNNRR